MNESLGGRIARIAGIAKIGLANFNHKLLFQFLAVLAVLAILAIPH